MGLLNLAENIGTSNGSFGTGIGNFFNNLTGVSATQAYNAKQAEIDRNFNSAEAEKAFNRELYADSTAMQRRMADLKKAGINPLMAVQGASAGSVNSAVASSSPASSSGSGGDIIISAILRGVSQIVSSAVKGSASRDAALIRTMKK